MIVHPYVVAGEPVQVHFPERPEDLEGFWAFLERPRRALAIDTETTSLDTYAQGFGVRLVQFGDLTDAWVLRVDRFREAIAHAIDLTLKRRVPVVLHNATFDLLNFDAHGFARLEDTYPRAFDTKLLAHLLDPRQKSEGGTGLGLKELSAAHVDPTAPDTQAGLHEVFRSLGLTKETGWAAIPIDHPTYVLYAGLDVILTARLFEVLGPEVRRRGHVTLARFEHALAALLARLERRGMLLDVDYAEGLITTLEARQAEGEAEAAVWGIANVNAPQQVAHVLLALGAYLPEKTKTGQPKTDKAVLEALVENFEDQPLGAAAAAVLKAKRASKFRTSYVEMMLALRDDHDRVHPKIASLQARTARMSISRPPLQQLPSGDWTIRRALLADPGHAIVACDYSQVEMRVLAALSGDRKMLQAIRSGMDLHDAVATILFGEGFTKAQRKLAKNTGFGEVFGGGAPTLARQAGVDIDTAKAAKALFARQFPGIKRYGRRLVDKAQVGDRAVRTPSGRRLPLDRDRLYAATNYMVQSSARDVLAQALLDLDAAGLGDHLLLPVHDEVIAQAPVAEAADVAHAIKETMTMEFHGVRLDADAEVYGASWGHGYGAPE